MSPDATEDDQKGDTEEEEPPPSDEEALALQMRMDRQEKGEQTLSNESDGPAATRDKIIKNIK